MAKSSSRVRLEQLQERFHAVEGQLADPAITSDQKRLAELGREHSHLTDAIGVAKKLVEAEDGLEQSREILKSEKDDEMRELAELEVADCEETIERLTEELQFMLMPKDPLDDRNILMEIRAGTGGDEAGLFAADLMRMYLRFAETQGWKTELLSETESGAGGFREVIFKIMGDGAYSLMKHEGGVHRVQRVPATETQGRIHTSAATVAIMPEAEETDIELKDADLRVDKMCAHGPGGQGVNTTYSAVRLVHLPTGMIVTCQDERSQHKNLAKAMSVMRSRLLDEQRRKEEAARSASRKSMVGSGDRSERIRTYNFPQNRLTDHRINLTMYSLDRFVEGDMTDVLKALRKHELQERMAEIAR